jgi:hypothetical protein
MYGREFYIRLARIINRISFWQEFSNPGVLSSLTNSRKDANITFQLTPRLSAGATI